MTADHLGSPRIITDDDRDVVSRHDYLAFGDEVTETVGNVANRTTTQGYGQDDDIGKQYTGYERDKESGLNFAQARYYNSQHGRFTSVDPLTASANVKNPQTFNRYSYVMNSPYKFTDPLGLLAVHSGSYGNGLEGGGGGGITGAMSSAWANPLFMKQQQQKDGKYYTAKDGTIQCRGDCETRLSTEITPEPIEQLPAVVPQAEPTTSDDPVRRADIYTEWTKPDWVDRGPDKSKGRAGYSYGYGSILYIVLEDQNSNTTWTNYDFEVIVNPEGFNVSINKGTASNGKAEIDVLLITGGKNFKKKSTLVSTSLTDLKPGKSKKVNYLVKVDVGGIKSKIYLTATITTYLNKDTNRVEVKTDFQDTKVTFDKKYKRN